MGTQPISQQHKQEVHASPYCFDPNCKSCKELREVQEAIRLRPPVPEK